MSELRYADVRDRLESVIGTAHATDVHATTVTIAELETLLAELDRRAHRAVEAGSLRLTLEAMSIAARDLAGHYEAAPPGTYHHSSDVRRRIEDAFASLHNPTVDDWSSEDARTDALRHPAHSPEMALEMARGVLASAWHAGFTDGARSEHATTSHEIAPANPFGARP